MRNQILNCMGEIPFGLAMVATLRYFSPLEINANSQKVTLLIYSDINEL